MNFERMDYAMKLLYETSVTNTGGRAGKAASADGHLVVDIVRPQDQKDKGLSGTNPEQLFAAGYSSCFNGALNLMLKKGGAKFEFAKVTATVGLYEDPEDNGFKIGVRMQAHIEGMGLDEARKYVELAHAFCPYSKAIKGNVEVTLEII